MSAIQRLPQVGGTLSIAAGIFAVAGIPSLRHRFTDLLGRGVTGNMLRLLAVAFALLNLKNLPFVWHVRLALPSYASRGKELTIHFIFTVESLQRPDLPDLPE